eukprot:1153215-Pelagomonas_calceolata.AAC.10
MHASAAWASARAAQNQVVAAHPLLPLMPLACPPCLRACAAGHTPPDCCFPQRQPDPAPAHELLHQLNRHSPHQAWCARYLLLLLLLLGRRGWAVEHAHRGVKGCGKARHWILL